MHPLRTVALGLLVVHLVVQQHGWDLLPDPLGWLVVLAGLAALRAELPRHGALVGAALVSLAVAALTWPPGWALAEAVRDDPSLGWLASVPALAFGFLLADALRARLPEPWARRFGGLRRWYVLAASLPVLVYGGGWDWLAAPAGALVVVLHVLMVVWLWSAAGTPATTAAADPPGRSDVSEPRT